MNSSCTEKYWKLFAQLPPYVQKQAKIAYAHFKQDIRYSGLHFKCINQQKAVYSARVGKHYRVLGRVVDNEIIWFWIGPHTEYEHIISSL